MQYDQNSCSLPLSCPHLHENVIYCYTSGSSFGDCCTLSLGQQDFGNECFNKMNVSRNTSRTSTPHPPPNPSLMCDMVKFLHISKPQFPSCNLSLSRMALVVETGVQESGQTLLRLGHRLAHCHFYHILLAKANTNLTQFEGWKQTPSLDGRSFNITLQRGRTEGDEKDWGHFAIHLPHCAWWRI